jgi:hypothetical protein
MILPIGAMHDVKCLQQEGCADQCYIETSKEEGLTYYTCLRIQTCCVNLERGSR